MTPRARAVTSAMPACELRRSLAAARSRRVRAASGGAALAAAGRGHTGITLRNAKPRLFARCFRRGISRAPALSYDAWTARPARVDAQAHAPRDAPFVGSRIGQLQPRPISALLPHQRPAILSRRPSCVATRSSSKRRLSRCVLPHARSVDVQPCPSGARARARQEARSRLPSRPIFSLPSAQPP